MVKIEEELSAIGENQKQLEISEEKARRREEKYQVLTFSSTSLVFTSSTLLSVTATWLKN